MQLLRCSIGGKSVLVDDDALLRRVAPGVKPEALEADHVYHFSQDLTRLGQGVMGVALVNDTCLPIVSEDYFRAGRVSIASVRTIDRGVAAHASAAGARRFFIFGVPGAAGFQFAVSMNQVLEVAPALPLASLNFAHSHFAGVTVWRGDTVPVIDLAFAARLGVLVNGWTRLMIVRNRANRIFAIPAMGQVRQPASASQVYAPDSGSVRPMRGIRGIFRFESSPLLVPDLDALVD